jgi:hypothetical protein
MTYLLINETTKLYNVISRRHTSINNKFYLKYPKTAFNKKIIKKVHKIVIGYWILLDYKYIKEL